MKVRLANLCQFVKKPFIIAMSLEWSQNECHVIHLHPYISELHPVTAASSSVAEIVSTASNLEVIFDSQLTMSGHISTVCRTGFFSAIRQLQTIHRLLDNSRTRQLAHRSTRTHGDSQTVQLADEPGRRRVNSPTNSYTTLTDKLYCVGYDDGIITIK